MCPSRKFFASVAICSCTLVGCSDSGLVSTVAEKAARVATLEVELTTAKETAESAQQELQQVRTKLADAETKLNTAEATAMKEQQHSQELSNQNSELAKKNDSMATQLALAKSQLGAIAAERRLEQQRLALVGEWHSTDNGQFLTRDSDGFNLLEFRQDGTGVYRQGSHTLKAVKNIAYQISWNETAVPGVYDLRGVSGQQAKEPVKGTFRVQPDGSTAVLEGWDTTAGPRGYERALDKPDGDKPGNAAESPNDSSQRRQLPRAASSSTAREELIREKGEEFERLRTVRGDQLEKEINAWLDKTGRQAGLDPDGSLKALKEMLRMVVESDDLKPDVRRRLEQQIQQQVAQLIRGGGATPRRSSDIYEAEADVLRRRRPELVEPAEPADTDK